MVQTVGTVLDAPRRAAWQMFPWMLGNSDVNPIEAALDPSKAVSGEDVTGDPYTGTALEMLGDPLNILGGIGLVKKLGKASKAKAFNKALRTVEAADLPIPKSKLTPELITDMVEGDYYHKKDLVDATAARQLTEMQRKILPTRSGATRVYRVGPRPSEYQPLKSEWLNQALEQEGVTKARGRWFDADAGAIPFYANQYEGKFPTRYLDLTPEQAERFAVGNYPEAANFSRKWGSEHFVPLELANQAQLLRRPVPSLSPTVAALMGYNTGARAYQSPSEVPL